MRHYYCQFVLLIAIITGSIQGYSAVLLEDDSITMGGGYANEIYYSFENGEVGSAARNNWDIAFYTLTWSAGIIINDGNGVQLYLYPTADTSGWNTVDTTGLSTWPVLYNSTLSWEEGAFNRNELGHPDYGWGVYNTITHDVVGDSLYILKLGNGSFKKFQVIRKASIQNTYYFRYADLNGANEVNETVNCSNYAAKNFVYYSLINQTILDREPDSDSWDILFTKYMGLLEGGVPYPVTGVLNNINIPANRFDGVDPDYEDYNAAPLDSTRAPIGHNWKYFDMNTFSYVVEDSIAFFVMNAQKDIYKLVFSVFDYTAGKVVFTKSKVHTSTVGEITSGQSFSMFPNPAGDAVRVTPDENSGWEEITITDLTGKVVSTQKFQNQHSVLIPVNKLNRGVYLVTVKSGTVKVAQKLVIQ
jgi:hypothetical protein